MKITKPITYRSVCSGIESASVAWEPLGFRPLSFAEIEPFPCSVLAHRYPNVPNLGDMTKYHDWIDYEQTDVVVGGTPCQSFSVAGLRKGMDDPRGNLALVYLGIVDRFRPTWFAWENVPGVLSSGGGRDFGTFLGAVAKLGYGFAYRILDAQFFGVPQRRRRVFVVGHIRDWRLAAAVLFESESLRGNIKTSGKKRKAVAALTANGVGTCGADDNQGQAGHLIAHTLRGNGFDASEDGTGRGIPLVPVAFTCKDYGADASEISPTLRSMGHVKRQANGGGKIAIQQGPSVRRLTPVECERLQGFPDNWTQVPHRNKPAADGPRYKAIGNSKAVPVVRWIGERIKEVHSRNK